MYRRPKFLELLLEIREQMSREADYDMDLLAELVRSGRIADVKPPKRSEKELKKGRQDTGSLTR